MTGYLRTAPAFVGILSGGVTHGELTDSRGEAHFNTSNGSGEIFVQGRSLFRGRLAGRHVVYIWSLLQNSTVRLI